MKNWFHRRVYDIAFWLSLLFLVLYCKYTVRGRRNVPRQRACLFVANHQSGLDMSAIGVALPVYPEYVARITLMKNRVGRTILRWLGAIPFDFRDSTKGALAVLRLLKSGYSVVIFAEGTRTLDGEVHVFKQGIAFFIKMMMKMKNVCVVPIALDGSFQTLPKGAKFPSAYENVVVSIGKPIDPQAFKDMSDEEIIAKLRGLVMEQFENARRIRRR